MVADAADRLRHVRDAVASIRTLLEGKTGPDALSDVIVRAALERFLEIVSEASRHIPTEWKDEHGSQVPWRDIANFGNLLRHAYQNVDARILWAIYADDLDPLEAAIDAMLAAHPDE